MSLGAVLSLWDLGLGASQKDFAYVLGHFKSNIWLFVCQIEESERVRATGERLRAKSRVIQEEIDTLERETRDNTTRCLNRKLDESDRYEVKPKKTLRRRRQIHRIYKLKLRRL